MNNINGTGAGQSRIGADPDAWEAGSRRILESYGLADLPTPDVTRFAGTEVEAQSYLIPWTVELGRSMDVAAAFELVDDLYALART